jgi:primosomal protein N' (replication factor Y)
LSKHAASGRTQNLAGRTGEAGSDQIEGGVAERPPSSIPPPSRVARVVPDLTGLDKEFDYLVPDGVDAPVGARVRVPLHGRRVAGWVVAIDPPDVVAAPRLRPILSVSSIGPAAELVELARWASVRWAAGRLRPFLVTASPQGNVVALPPPRRTRHAPAPRNDAAIRLLARGGPGGMLRLPPAADVIPVLLAAAALGPTLVVVPSVDRARLEATRLRRAGLTVAVVPGEWAAAAAGVDVVIGARAAAWAPCPGMAVAVVVDEHDEALQEERSPTWHARDVLVERARRAGVAVLLVSPCPTVSGLAAVHDRLARPAIDDERAGWPLVEIVDRSRDEPWKTSLVTSQLIGHLRTARTVVCVHNTPGRGRILACRSCRMLARCAVCDAAVRLADDGTLSCRRCGTVRPAVCLHCGGSSFANLRPGVTRLREELEAAAGRPVVAVTGRDAEPPPDAGVYVGTEAVLHRVPRADVVAFLDIDTELLAPRYRAAEQTIALLVRGARLTGDRRAGGRLLVQTFLPRHEVVQAVLLADPGRLVEPERTRRRMLGLPPSAALAAISGPGSDEMADALRARDGIEVGGGASHWTVRAPTWEQLGTALIATPRPKGSRVRVEVDPPRA